MTPEKEFTDPRDRQAWLYRKMADDLNAQAAKDRLPPKFAKPKDTPA